LALAAQLSLETTGTVRISVRITASAVVQDPSAQSLAVTAARVEAVKAQRMRAVQEQLHKGTTVAQERQGLQVEAVVLQP
jgi:hypothetical protein